jgi:hypothetical protein
MTEGLQRRFWRRRDAWEAQVMPKQKRHRTMQDTG